MESPPSNSTWSEAFILSDDSGLLLTNSSISSGSSKSGRNRLPLEDSDCDDKSLSQDSLDGMSDIMCGENFNTLKKGPHWTDYSIIKHSSPIEPPLEFQDHPKLLEEYSNKLSIRLLNEALLEYRDVITRQLKNISSTTSSTNYYSRQIHLVGRSYYTTEFIPFSPCHNSGRPGSRSSLGSSRLSSSHNSLSVPAAHKVDDSSFITQAVSHDTLSSNQISDLYNVPFDSDMYAVPIDVVKPPLKPRRNQQIKKKRRNTSSCYKDMESRQSQNRSVISKRSTIKSDKFQYHWYLQKEAKRHSVAGSCAPIEGEPIHMTLQEVRHYLQTLYSSSSDSSDHKEKLPNRTNRTPSVILTSDDKYTNIPTNNVNVNVVNKNKDTNNVVVSNINGRTKKSTFLINIKNKKVKDSCDNNVVGKQIDISSVTNNKTTTTTTNNDNNTEKCNNKKPPAAAKLFSFKQTLCNMFRFRRFLSPEHVKGNEKGHEKNRYGSEGNLIDETHNNISSRALPPLPFKEDEAMEEQTLDFATSIQRVKDYGWYWGPLPSEVAEKILSNEPDGSFIVRDSSDDHYIFSLTFKLNNCVRHVRIDHDQGNFSFGSCTKFKSQTIVEFIENAVEHSRSGRYLFFLHRRPVIGPVRVQLLHPVSRFKQVQSLQHICRFVIHKVVRRDLIPSLPLPRRMIDYLNTPHYYSEHLIDDEDTSSDQVPPPSRVPTPAIRRDYNEEDVGNDPRMPINNYIVLNNNNNNNNSNNNNINNTN